MGRGATRPAPTGGATRNGKGPALAGRVEPARGVVGTPALAQGEAIELPHRRAPPDAAPGAEAPKDDNVVDAEFSDVEDDKK